MVKCTLHFIIAIIATSIFSIYITSFHNILSNKFLASNIAGLLILLISFFFAYYSIRFVFKTSLLRFQWLGGILAFISCTNLIEHQSAIFIAMASAAITVYIISKYRHRKTDNLENTFRSDIRNIWSKIHYMFIIDDSKIIQSDKQLLKTSIIYKIIYWICISVLAFFVALLFKYLFDFYSLSSCENMTIKEYLTIIQIPIQLFMTMSLFPLLIATLAYFRIRHIRSIKFYRKKLKINN